MVLHVAQHSSFVNCYKGCLGTITCVFGFQQHLHGFVFLTMVSIALCMYLDVTCLNMNVYLTEQARNEYNVRCYPTHSCDGVRQTSLRYKNITLGSLERSV